MSNREKIIVVIAVLALIYGGYVVFLEPIAQQPTFANSQNQFDDMNAFITTVAAATKEGLSEKDSYIIKRAENPWINDPMARMSKPMKTDEDEASELTRVETGPGDRILYTGYLEMGTMRLAIINGNEYSAGDRLEQSSYVVRSITPSQVVLAIADGTQNMFIIPLQETQ
jgi:hypothetical protein